VLLAALAVGPAAADSISTESDGADVVEISHEVDVAVAGDMATLRVRRSFLNRGDRGESIVLWIDLPDGAVATGMRIRTADRWHRAALLRADEAGRRFEHEKPRPGAPDQDPALLSWASLGRLSLRIYHIPAGSAATVEYRLALPTERDQGKVSLSYPLTRAPGLTDPVFRVSAPRAGDRIWIDGVATPSGAARVVALPGAEHGAGDGVVTSLIDVKEPGAGSEAVWVRVFATHPRPGDLEIRLFSPSGASQPLSAADSDLATGVAVDSQLGADPAGKWKLEIRDTATGETGTLHGWRLSVAGPGEPRTHRSARAAAIPDASVDRVEQTGVASLAVATDPGRLVARYGAVPLAGGGAVARLHLDLPTTLGSIPDDLQVAFVIDASRSVEPGELEAQLDLVAAYLATAPTARFEIVRFDRRARRLLGRFAAASEYPAIRARLTAAGDFERANGSALDRGVTAAAVALAGARGTPRIVIASDGLVRSRFDTPGAVRALRGFRGIAHLVMPGGGAPYSRDDDHGLAAIAASTGGMTVTIPGGDELALAARSLVRPTQIDKAALAGPFTDPLPAVLVEGLGVRINQRVDTAAHAVTLTGMIWGRPLRQLVKATGSDSTRAAALVFGDELFHALEDADMEPLARRGGVVSPATSLLTTRPGQRPFIGFGFGTYGTSCGIGCRGPSLWGTAVGTTPTPLLLSGPLARCARQLPAGTPIEAIATLETSYAEIVDVEVSSPSPALASCLREEIWAHELPAEQAGGPLLTRQVALGRSSLAALRPL
jgi:hypothetical protein